MKIEYMAFNKKCNETGALTFLEGEKDIPFSVKRIYYIYGVTDNSHRGFHAHKNLKQILISVCGSCTVLLDDGSEKVEVTLDNPNQGLYIGPMCWHEMYDFSEDAVLLVLASDYYDESDYIRDYNLFEELIGVK